MAVYELNYLKDALDLDMVHTFVIIAKDSKTARKMASAQGMGEGKASWLDPKLSSCRTIAKKPYGADRVVAKVTTGGF